MMRSLFSGVSGLKNHQTRMDVVGNNLANVNTVGYKYNRVNFSDVLSQTVQGAGAPQNGRGGTNPMQVGLGVNLASIDTVFTDGSFQPTGKQTDLAIKGQGFFIVSDGAKQYYTRAGNFDFDTNGNYEVPGTGRKVMGWLADTGGDVNTTAPVSTIQVPVGTSMAPRTSGTVSVANNLSADAAAGETAATSINVYDSLGNAHKVEYTFTKAATPDNTWTVTALADGAAAAVTNDTITFGADGLLTAPATAAAGPQLTVPASGGAAAFSVTMDLYLEDGTTAALTQFGGESTVQASGTDGYAAGTLESTVVDTSGLLVGRFSNNKTMNLAQVALATFNNPAGLEKSGDSLFVKSANSGEPQVGPGGSGGRGTFMPGTLEMSNVDMAQEFTNMIVTQRGFQANSRVITTSDQMLEELANLKR